MEKADNNATQMQKQMENINKVVHYFWLAITACHTLDIEVLTSSNYFYRCYTLMSVLKSRPFFWMLGVKCGLLSHDLINYQYFICWCLFLKDKYGYMRLKV